MVIAGVEETIEVLADNHLCSKVSKYYKRIFVSLYMCKYNNFIFLALTYRADCPRPPALFYFFSFIPPTIHPFAWKG